MMKFTAEQLEPLNKLQLREACRDNGIAYAGMNNEGMRAALLLVPAVPVASEPVVEGAVEQPVVEGAVEPQREPKVLPTLQPPVVPEPKPERKIQANRPERNGVKRPSENTICAQIWAWCDAAHDKGEKVNAKDLRAALPALDDTTKTVQFYRWRKFNGITGRQ
jgi:hypothetical protein